MIHIGNRGLQGLAGMALSEYAIGMHGKLIAAARALLGLSQEDLACRAGISRPTLRGLESDQGNPKRHSERAVIDALETEGISFVETPERVGVFLSKPSSK